MPAFPRGSGGGIEAVNNSPAIMAIMAIMAIFLNYGKSNYELRIKNYELEAEAISDT